MKNGLVVAALCCVACTVDSAVDSQITIERACVAEQTSCGALTADGSTVERMKLCVKSTDRTKGLSATLTLSDGTWNDPAPTTNDKRLASRTLGNAECRNISIAAPATAGIVLIQADISGELGEQTLEFANTPTTVTLATNPVELSPGTDTAIEAQLRPASGNVSAGTRVGFTITAIDPPEATASLSADSGAPASGVAVVTLRTNSLARAVTIDATALYSDGTTSSSSDSITINAAPQFDLTVAPHAGTGTGTVRATTGVIDCGATCTARVVRGAQVELKAEPTAGSKFGGWSDSCSGLSTTCTVTMTAARTVTAQFDPPSFELSINTVGGGEGVVISDPVGINCGGDCAELFVRDTAVELTALPIGATTFVGWAGSCTGSALTCTVTMDRARSVTAQFVPPPP